VLAPGEVVELARHAMPLATASSRASP